MPDQSIRESVRQACRNWHHPNDRAPGSEGGLVFKVPGDPDDNIVRLARNVSSYCDGVFESLDVDRLSAKSGVNPVTFGAMSALAHLYLPYGNLITYLRHKGIVPPSTARRGGRWHDRQHDRCGVVLGGADVLRARPQALSR